MVLVWAGTVAITLLVFTTSYSGITFLNQKSRTDLINKANIAKKLDSMSE